ncbi:hypothetical protein VOLCADRAFT_117545 [Volvox carteri f. nagariensis]|uniref:Peptidase S54 rhomboid domain-containing protein n=1 Tax=Volvox carteri f. nagariensis TaxID=3068 RepID=D8TV20_VOLCA|nr:uncharacterized protein VOLCADRAFT_117545 [Volvox carteri f. nagariensis]EFJ48625.1 hypothetical protein VOLCADRAFT_117545 [Volvox carteri f. nagariensis]|eukprot:XP_002950424.1 hypothetical protein VOLCADRAFT_117545 [Volvox carteri f. nagariensis]
MGISEAPGSRAVWALVHLKVQFILCGVPLRFADCGRSSSARVREMGEHRPAVQGCTRGTGTAENLPMATPRRIYQTRVEGQWWRLITSGFLHMDEWHLYFNMSSLVWKGIHLERRYGHKLFALLVAEMLLLSHGLYVLVTLLLCSVSEHRHIYYHQHAVGFSAVLFGLKTILMYNTPGYDEIFGVRVPTKYACWAELVLIWVLVPKSSFIGHLCGILAGGLHAQYLEPSLRRWWPRVRVLQARIPFFHPENPPYRSKTGGGYGELLVPYFTGHDSSHAARKGVTGKRGGEGGGSPTPRGEVRSDKPVLGTAPQAIAATATVTPSRRVYDRRRLMMKYGGDGLAATVIPRQRHR